MRVWIDGEVKIEDAVLKAGSVCRQVVERSVNGLDGVGSIELGKRGRDIEIEGVLRGVSGYAMDCFSDMIEAKMDNGLCVLVVDDGREYGDVRIDELEISERQFSGSSVSCKCMIKCKQLKS